MTTTNFTDGLTPIVADWLNDVDAYVYEPAIYRDFNTNPGTVLPQTGRLHWDTVEMALTADRGTDCHINLGQMQVLPPCQNTTGVTIPKGTFLMVTGVAADKLKIAPAVTNGTVDFKWMVGFALADIIAGSVDGCVITDGIIDNVNTQAWAVGTVLYPDPLVAGGLTSTQPAAPNYKAPIAIVTRQQLNNGRIYVRMQLPSRLGDTDSNVQFTGLANKDLIVYDSATSLWKNAANTAANVTVADTGANYTATDVEGVLAELPSKFVPVTANITSGNWTPTLTPVAGVTSGTVSIGSYIQVGNNVFVSGRINVVLSATTASLRLSLPVAKTTAQTYGGGTVVSPIAPRTQGWFYPILTPNALHLELIADATGTVDLAFSGAYYT